MEFCTSFAVINSAFNLASKQPACNGLTEYKKNGNDRRLLICCKAVREAVNRPWEHSSKDNMKLKITTALLAKIIQSPEEKECTEDWTVENDADYFSAVTVGLPSFNKAFLYDVVKNCGLSKELCQVIFSFQQKVAGGLLVELFQYLRTESDGKDILLLADLLESLSLEYCPYMSEKRIQADGTWKTHGKIEPNPIEKLDKFGNHIEVKEADFCDVMGELLECLDVILPFPNEQEDRLVLRIFLALLGFVNCLTSGKVQTRNITESKDKSLQKYIRYFKIMNCNSQHDFEEAYFYLQTLQIDDAWSKDSIRHKADKLDIINLIQCCEKIRNVMPSVSDVIFKQWKEQLADVALLTTSNGVVCENKLESQKPCPPDVNMTLALFRIADGKLPEYDCSELVAFSNNANEMRLILENMLKNCYQLSAQKLKVKTASAVVDLKWDSYQEHLMMLCSLPIEEVLLLHDGWFDFLKRNISCIKSNELKEILVQLETLSMERKKEQGDMTIVILAAYKRLNMCEMLDVLEYVIVSHSPEELFRPQESNRFKTKLVSVFNKLANITDTEKAVGEICSLAIQSPRNTLLKILYDAVDNPGQQPLLMKLLQNIPALCFLETKTGRSSVGQIMEKLFVDSSRDEKKRNSYNKLLTRLLRGHSLLHGRSVLEPGTFLQSTVLPHLSEDTNMTLESVLQLLLTTIQSRESLSWISGDVLFPVVLTLCNIIDELRIFEPENLDTNIVVKNLTVSILSRIEKRLLQRSAASNGVLVNWLFKSTRNLHWMTALRLRKIFAQVAGCALSLPTSLKQFLQDTGDQWLFNIDSVNQLGDLLEFALISDETLRIVLDDGDPIAYYGIPDVNQQTIVVLSEKLKNSTSDEWNRASEVVQYLIRNDAMTVSIRPAAREAIPCVNLADLKSVIGTAQIFWELLVLMARSPEEADLGYSMMACKEYVTVIKTLLERQNKQDGYGFDKTFVLSHLFCQNCFLLSELTLECRETLLVLVLDILSNHSKFNTSLLKSSNSTAETELIAQKTAMKKAVKLTPRSQQEILSKRIQR